MTSLPSYKHVGVGHEKYLGPQVIVHRHTRKRCCINNANKTGKVGVLPRTRIHVKAASGNALEGYSSEVAQMPPIQRVKHIPNLNSDELR